MLSKINRPVGTREEAITAPASYELPPDAVEYGELELYLRKMNEGQKLTAPNIRH